MDLLSPSVLENTSSIAAGSSGTVQITPVAGYPLFLSKVNITPGANTSITKIEVDGIDIKMNGSSNDILTEFGYPMCCRTSLVVTLSNSNTAAENTTVEAKGLVYS